MKKKLCRYLTALALTAVLALGSLEIPVMAKTDAEGSGSILSDEIHRDFSENPEEASSDALSSDNEDYAAAEEKEDSSEKSDSEETDAEEEQESHESAGFEDKKEDTETTDSGSSSEAQEEVEEALYFVPHQDDEMLTFSAGILTDLYEGREVHVVLVTDGRESKAYTALKKEVPSLTRDQFVEIRDREFKESLMALGVREENIHIPKNRIADGKASVQTESLRSLMEAYLELYPEAAVRTEYPTGEISSEHKDHSCLGDMAIALKKEGKIRTLRMFADPYQYSTYLKEGMPELSTLSPDINEDTAKAFDAALEVYYRYDPDQGYYRVGYLSAPAYLNALKKNRINYYFDYHNEGMIRYSGKNRYETCAGAVGGAVSKESEEANYAAPETERKDGKAPIFIPDSSKVLIYDDRIYAPHQGKGNTEDQQGNSDEAGGTLVIAWGDNFPDALSAVSLGYEILITKTATLPESIRQEILRIMPSRIIVIGGRNSVSDQVISELENIAGTATAEDLEKITGGRTEESSDRKLVYQPKVERCSGLTRYETALEILKQYGFNSTSRTLIVTTGENFADALSIAPYAAKTHSPVLLCRNGKLNDSARKVLESLRGRCTRLLLIGAENVVSGEVEKLGKKLGMEVIRLAGNNRYETCAKVVEYELSANVGLSAEHFSVAVGTNFPDALIAGTITANNGSVLFLVDSKTEKWSRELALIRKNRELISEDYIFYIYGAEAVVSQKVENAILTAMS